MPDQLPSRYHFRFYVLLSKESVKDLDCFENQKEFSYVRRVVFRKVLKGSTVSL